MKSVVFNRHSLPFRSKEEAEKGIEEFVLRVNECRNATLKVLWVGETVGKSLTGVELLGGYFVRDWYNRYKKDSKKKDLVRLFLRIETQQPLFEGISGEELNNMDVGLKDSQKGEEEYKLAYYFKTLLVSFNSSELWENSRLNVWCYKLDETEESNEEGVILNLSTNKTYEDNKEFLEKIKSEKLSTPMDIWNNRVESFPNLELLEDRIGKSLRNWSGRSDIIKKLKLALICLDDFCKGLKDGVYLDYRHEHLRACGLDSDLSGESSSVKSDPRKRKERTCTISDGTKVFFENHIKLPDGYRLYFYVDLKKKKVYIGYFGPHL